MKTAVYFDDDIRINYPRSFIVNGAIFAEQMPYPRRKDVTYLLGAKYAPIRKELWDVLEKRQYEKLETAMITLGGTDIHNITPKVLKLLNNTHPKLLKKVIIGYGFEDMTKIDNLKTTNVELIYYPDATGMKNVMLESDIAIAAGGQTLYELARIGVPTIGICVAQNQSQNIQGWEKSGFLEYIGWYNDENLLDNLREAINKLVPHEERFRRSKIGKKYIDGNGSKRIIGKLINKSELRSKVDE